MCFATTSALHDAVSVRGVLRSDRGDETPLDLLAVDAAYPAVVCPDEHRKSAHQAWQFGELAMVEEAGRVTAAVPGTRFDANVACDVIRRLAKSVGAPTRNYTVSLAL